MQRFVPTGRYFSSALIAFTAALSACGGGSSDAGSSTANVSGSSADASSQAGVTASSGSAATATDAQTSVETMASKAIDVPAAAAAATVTATETATETATVTSAAAAADTGDVTIVASTAGSTVATSHIGGGGTIVSPPGAVPASTAVRSGAGLNLSALSYYSPEIATFDVMKRAGVWLTQCNTSALCTGFTNGAGSWDTLEESALNLDANGYPRTLPAASDATVKYRKVSSMISANGALPAGRYVVVYDGAGTLSYSGNVTKQASLSKAGRDVVDLAAGSTASFLLTISATDPTNYLRNIRVFMPGGACSSNLQVYAADASACTAATGTFTPFESFPKGAIWNPQFLADVKGFRTLRFMDWGATNSNLITSWAKRPLITDRVWTTAGGMPLEAMFDLSNTVSAEPWINLPPHVDDDYILQFSRLATTTVNASLKINLEYANEPWNYAFPATKWMLAQGQAAWPDEVAKGTSIYVLENNWYARRLVQACGIAKGASTGAAARFRCVSNTQAAQPSQTDQVLACAVAAKTLGQACAKSIDVAAIAPYFGNYFSNANVRPTMATWYTAADGGLSNLFQELTGHDSTGKAVVEPFAGLNTQAPSGAIPQAIGWMVGTKTLLAKYGIPMWAYEGGQHLVPPIGDTDANFLALTIAANRDPRMQGAYEQMIAGWQDAGGQTFAYFSHVVTPSKSGSWGLKETMTDNNNPKWKATLERRNAACSWAGC